MEIFAKFSHLNTTNQNYKTQNKKSDISSVKTFDKMANTNNSLHRQDKFNKSNTNEKNNNFEKASSIICISSLIVLLIMIYNKIKNGKTKQTTPQDLPPEVPDKITTLINILKPKDKELAKEFYPFLIEHAHKIGLEQKDFEKIICAIDDKNKNFIKKEGLQLIVDNFENIKDLIIDIPEDLSNLVKKLSSKNKNFFKKIIDNKDKFILKSLNNLFKYLDIEPTKHELILKQTLPLINKYADSFAIQDNASQHAKLLNAITAKNKYLIELVAQSKVPNDDKYIKYLILKHSTDENNNIAEVILHNLEKANLQRKDVSYILNVLKNDEVPQLRAIIPYYQYLKSKNIPLQEVSQQLKNEFNIKIFNKIMEKADIYNIIDIVDIRLFLENINEKNSDFVINKLLPELLKYKQKLLLKVPDQYVDLIKSITPDTIKEIEKIARYADNYGNNLSYVNILSGITTQNAKNIDRVMENIKNTDFWGNSLVSASDFQKLLDEAK